MSARPGVVAAGLFLLGLALFLPALGERDVWNPDEPRYAQVAREMTREGQYLVPRLNGAVYMDKPPLFFWSVMAVGAIVGRIDEAAVRLPSALAAAGTLALTYGIGRRLLSARAGILGALVLLSTFKIVWQARFGQIDMLLTFLVALATWLWVRGYLSGDSRWYPWFFVTTGLATLAKGPAGFLPPLLAILVFLAVTRDGPAFRSLGLGRGVLLWALVVAAWFVPASLAAGGGYGVEIGFRQTVARYLSPWGHQNPWYHYAESISGDFLPWSLFLPTTALVLWREARDHRGVVFCACWVLVTLLFFTLSPGKRGVYILTMYPGMVLLVGAALERAVAEWPRYRAWVSWPLAVLALGCGVVTAGLLIRPPARPTISALPAMVDLATALIAFLGAGSFIAFLLVRGSHLRAAFVVVIGAVSVVLFVSMVVILPRFDAVTSLRPVAAAVDREVPPDTRYGIYPKLQNPILFYGHRYAEVLTSEQELDAFLRRPGPHWLVLEGGDARAFDERLPAPVAEIGIPGTESWYSLFELEGRERPLRTARLHSRRHD